MAFVFSIPKQISSEELEFTCLPVMDTPDADGGDEDPSVWVNIPAVPLVHIFSYLPAYSHDRLNMALVCKEWHQHFYDPSLWRKKDFYFGGVNAIRNDPHKMLVYAARLGRPLKYLKILCEHPSFNVCKKFQKAMSDLTGASVCHQWLRGAMMSDEHELSGCRFLLCVSKFPPATIPL